MKRIFLPLAAGLVILVLFLGWNDRLDWSPVSEGVILHEGTEVPLPPDLCRELVDLLEKSRRDPYTDCAAPSLPDGAITLSHPESPTRFHLLLEGPGSPRLVRERSGEYETAPLIGQAANHIDTDFYRDWSDWAVALSALLEPGASDALYALRTESRTDTDAFRAILDALGAEDVLGPYTLTAWTGGWRFHLTLAVEEEPQSELDRRWMEGFLDSRGKLLLALAPSLHRFDWYFPDGLGSYTDQHSHPSYTDDSYQTAAWFSSQYAQRILWWQDTRGYQEVICHPAYRIREILYQNTEAEHNPALFGLDTLKPAYSEYVFREGMFSESLNTTKSSHSTNPTYTAISDFSLSDPLYHPEDLLAGYEVRRAWAIDDTCRLYDTDRGLCLARWHSDDWESSTPYLLYAFLLEEIPVSDDLYSHFFPPYP